ncbi:MAG: amino acid ABC transporter permease [Oscillospiraceae bacterium]|nr:amino acid ABC transporter permease [Oscillospiraceae bacterium]
MIQQILTPWRWQNIFADWPLLLRAFLVTLEAAVLALILVLILGVIFGLLSTSRSRLLRIIAQVYVEFFQNTPLMIQLFFAYFALPYMGVVLPAFACGVLCVGIYTGAYISEVVRAGIESIPKGQSEAAYSQGFTRMQTMLLIVLPQTVKIVLPPLVNQCVNLIKNTSTLAMIAGGDLMYIANTWATNGMASYGPAYLLVGVLYFCLCFPLSKWARGYEERLKARHLVQNPAAGAANAEEVTA